MSTRQEIDSPGSKLLKVMTSVLLRFGWSPSLVTASDCGLSSPTAAAWAGTAWKSSGGAKPPPSAGVEMRVDQQVDQGARARQDHLGPHDPRLAAGRVREHEGVAGVRVAVDGERGRVGSQGPARQSDEDPRRGKVVGRQRAAQRRRGVVGHLRRDGGRWELARTAPCSPCPSPSGQTAAGRST